LNEFSSIDLTKTLLFPSHHRLAILRTLHIIPAHLPAHPVSN